MKIKKSQLRKIILESLLVEAISVAQAEEKLKKSIPKMIKSIDFIIKRDKGPEKLFKKYENKHSTSGDIQPGDIFKFHRKSEIDEGLNQLLSQYLYNLMIGDVISRDASDNGISNSILFLIKKMKEDPALVYYFLAIASSLVFDGNAPISSFVSDIRNSLELHDQFNHLIEPQEKRDLFIIKNIEELISLIATNKPKIDAENKRLGDRVDTQNVLNGFKPLTGKISSAKENNTLILVKNPQTGFYTIPDENGFVVGEIHSKAASVKLGSGTDWCTAAPGLDYFNEYYTPEDPLYYIEDNGKRFQFSYGKNQFMDVNDKEINDDLIEKYTSILGSLLIKRDGSIQNENIENYLLVLKASDPNTTAEDLDKLADHENRMVRRMVAENKNTSDATLLKLASDKHWIVRANLAMSSRSKKSAEVFLKLSEDRDSRVRLAVARNRSIPLDFLLKLSEDEDFQVRAAVAGNIATPTDVLLKLANEANTTTQIALVSNQNTPMEVLVNLSSSENSFIRKTAAARVSSAAENRLQEKWMKIAGLLN